MVGSHARAQTPEENLADVVDFSETFSDLQNEFQDANVRFESALAANEQTAALRAEASFFDGQNLGLWLGWSLLVVLLLLLIKVRGSLAKQPTVTVENSELKSQTSEPDQLRDTLAKKRAAPALVDPTTRALVQPVKTVKIKVRKIVKKK